MTTALVADMDPRLTPLTTQAGFDLASIDVVVNTHLHFDHCGENHMFAGKPIYVQRHELDDARTRDDYTIREWGRGTRSAVRPRRRRARAAARAPDSSRRRVTPRGPQVVVVETGKRPVIIAGDTAAFLADLDGPRTEGQRLVRALDPEVVWLSHETRAQAAGSGAATLGVTSAVGGVFAPGWCHGGFPPLLG